MCVGFSSVNSLKSLNTPFNPLCFVLKLTSKKSRFLNSLKKGRKVDFETTVILVSGYFLIKHLKEGMVMATSPIDENLKTNR